MTTRHLTANILFSCIPIFLDNDFCKTINLFIIDAAACSVYLPEELSPEAGIDLNKREYDWKLPFPFFLFCLIGVVFSFYFVDLTTMGGEVIGVRKMRGKRGCSRLWWLGGSWKVLSRHLEHAGWELPSAFQLLLVLAACLGP